MYLRWENGYEERGWVYWLRRDERDGDLSGDYGIRGCDDWVLEGCLRRWGREGGWGGFEGMLEISLGIWLGDGMVGGLVALLRGGFSEELRPGHLLWGKGGGFTLVSRYGKFKGRKCILHRI